jgi:hypothetical protein
MAQAISFVLVAAFQCQPISMAWTGTGPGKCVDINLFYLCNAALNIVTDILTYAATRTNEMACAIMTPSITQDRRVR